MLSSAPFGGNRARDKDNGSWMIIFADLLSLLLTFFVLLFSMNNVPSESWSAFSATMSESFAAARVSVSQIKTPSEAVSDQKTEEGFSASYLEGILSVQFEDLLNDNLIQLTKGKEQVTVSLRSARLFNPGQTSLNANGLQVAGLLADALDRLPNKIYIVGHALDAGNREQGTPRSFSLGRALGLSTEMKAQGYDKSLPVTGAGRNQLDMINPALSLDQRYMLADRVDIVVLTAGGNRGTDGIL